MFEIGINRTAKKTRNANWPTYWQLVVITLSSRCVVHGGGIRFIDLEKDRDMIQKFVGCVVFFGAMAVLGCSDGPGPTEKGGGFQLPPEAQKAQEDASKKSPEEMMEMMKKSQGKAGDPTKKN